MIARIASLLLIAFAACGDGGIDPVVVVQETNRPCTTEECVCERAHRVERAVTRSCDGVTATIVVCADHVVCEQAIDAVADRVIACDEPASPFDLDLSPCE
jgi:hypothetical protein